MSRKVNQDVSQELKVQILNALDNALKQAEIAFFSGEKPENGLSARLLSALTELSALAQKASTGFTNIFTCLAIKSARPIVDIRYHQVQIQNQTVRSAGFNFRGVSEKVIFPWLSKHSFEGAKSGWQTRTFERPKPYMLSYDENIGEVKEPFLITFDEIEEHNASAMDALIYLIYLQLLHRESKKIVLSTPRTRDIQLITQVFTRHFFYPYKASKGASRLPVLALYAIYTVLLNQPERYQGMELRSLEEHSAADSQTGAIGDIEIVRIGTPDVFEAVEVKHNIPLSERIIQDVAAKIMNTSVDRYYILTTHTICEPDDTLLQKIARIKALYNCQLIANGVIPSLKYYLRLLSDPSLVFPIYVNLLNSDKAIAHEHREIWNKLATQE